ncbi:hypothetical protein CDAR_77081 [Caerostris darwini]|uniref:Transmembrane protein n=1 Tax=Caerostris darwini TaxID=1538125 RepID=A0AAV4R558_9ARAC|nr:hypothetical protein CDAR_77081 [Caerostris darwini]
MRNLLGGFRSSNIKMALVAAVEKASNSKFINHYFVAGGVYDPLVGVLDSYGFLFYDSKGFFVICTLVAAVAEAVSLDARPIVIPILSCVLCFPVLAFAVICALRYRAIRLRQKDRLKRVQSGCRSVTLEIPARGDKSSFYSKDSSSDPSIKGMGEVSQAVPESPPLLTAPSTSGTSSRRSSKSNQHVKFMTTTAVFHGRTITGLNGRFKSTGKKQKIFWDEHSSHVECAQELEKELSQTLNS